MRVTHVYTFNGSRTETFDEYGLIIIHQSVNGVDEKGLQKGERERESDEEQNRTEQNSLAGSISIYPGLVFCYHSWIYAERVHLMC